RRPEDSKISGRENQVRVSELVNYIRRKEHCPDGMVRGFCDGLLEACRKDSFEPSKEMEFLQFI
ncbi:MAG TPA: hypothetical protein VIF12_01245, partial [Micavibrio sp.]